MPFLRPLLVLPLTLSHARPHPAPEPEVIDLWPARSMPGKPATAPESEVPRNDGFHRITNVSQPTLTFFPAPLSNKQPTPAVIVCPGGAYKYVVTDKEGTEIAAWLNRHGFSALVLKYRVPDNRDGALMDLQRAISLTRSRATTWHLLPDKIGVIGFSAGGHLAARASSTFNSRSYPVSDPIDRVSCRPDFAILVYPAYLATPDGRTSPDLNLSAAIPPTLFVHTDDDSAHIAGSKAYHKSLDAARIPNQFLLYPTGGHGYALHAPAPANAWPDAAISWLKSR
jgi:acetyl esterase/lipase